MKKVLFGAVLIGVLAVANNGGTDKGTQEAQLAQGACQLLEVYKKCAETMKGKNTPQNCRFISQTIGNNIRNMLLKRGEQKSVVDGAVLATSNACYAGCTGDKKIFEELDKMCRKGNKPVQPK